jgi:hypothetical protein
MPEPNSYPRKVALKKECSFLYFAVELIQLETLIIMFVILNRLPYRYTMNRLVQRFYMFHSLLPIKNLG